MPEQLPKIDPALALQGLYDLAKLAPVPLQQHEAARLFTVTLAQALTELNQLKAAAKATPEPGAAGVSGPAPDSDGRPPVAS